MCRSALHALSNNENQALLSFQTAELSTTEYEICWIFHIPSTFGTGNENEVGGIFIRFGVPDYWMDAAYNAPNRNILS
jgi:hypothetical protein